MKKAKVVLLFLLTMCIFDITVIYLKDNYIIKKQDELVNVVKENKIKENRQEMQEGCSNVKVNNMNKESRLKDDAVGMVIIPSINLEAPIHEGTNSDVLKYYVGHFKETSLWKRKYCTCFTQ